LNASQSSGGGRNDFGGVVPFGFML
jgi:hypothetical protein